MGGDGADMVSVSIDAGDGSPGYGPGDYGRRVVDFGAETLERASGVAVLPDGRIVVAGHGTRGMILVRLLADGDPDPSFGRGGVAVIPVAADVAGVAVVDGLIHVLARRAGDLHGTGVFRYSADGVLDASYGIDGFAPTQLTAASGLAATPDGGLLVGGSSQVVRLTPSGDIAATYGATNWPFRLVALTVQPDGKFVVLSENSQEVGAHLQRFHADGTVDESFFSAGWLTGTPVIADPGTLLLLADGRLAVSGRTTTVNGAPPPVRELVLAGFRTDGWLDNTFGTLGATRTDVGGVERVVAVHQQADGRIVSVFHRGQDAPADPVGLARYLPDGTLDPSFGAEGVATVAAVYPVASALTGTGRILVAGSAGADLAVARALPADADAPASYHPLEPVRLLDTRTGVGAPAGQLGARSTLRLAVAGRGGVPAGGAAAVLLNVTVTEPTEVSFLTAWPAGRPRPVASNLNVAPGQTAANLVVAKVGRFGSVDLYNNAGSAHVIADLAGWYGGTDGASYSTLSP
ncbi:MAG TPA: delta-60 repeat domain-containing protein, partial [Acidimicrobiales bacterium]|nr:delta-60 repeat domain-containing protein [Acidimicrobiales bacterium]